MTPSQVGSAGRAAQRDRTRRRLVVAAIELLRGGGTVTVEAAAAAAGISRATGYRYFATVDVLSLEAALTQTLESVDGPVAEVAALCARVCDHADRVEAVVRCMAAWAWDSQAALRVTLRHSLEGSYRRPGNREEWISLALAPASAELSPECAEQLRRALYPLFGLDPILSLVDLLHLDRQDALDTLAFSARALTTAALAASRPPQGSVVSRRDPGPF